MATALPKKGNRCQTDGTLDKVGEMWYNITRKVGKIMSVEEFTKLLQQKKIPYKWSKYENRETIILFGWNYQNIAYIKKDKVIKVEQTER